MSSFDSLLKDISALEQKLASPVAFHVSKQEDYIRAARAVARRVLADARPQAHDVASWSRKVEITLDRITSELMLGGGLGGGQIISLTAAPLSMGDLDAKDSRPQSQQVSHKDVVDWIRAGLAGEAGGKRITARDREILAKDNGENALATVVMRAYYSRNHPPNYTRLRRAIQRYLTGEDAATDPIFDQILAAWEIHFSTRFPRDLREHVTKLVAAF